MEVIALLINLYLVSERTGSELEPGAKKECKSLKKYARTEEENNDNGRAPFIEKSIINCKTADNCKYCTRRSSLATF